MIFDDSKYRVSRNFQKEKKNPRHFSNFPDKNGQKPGKNLKFPDRKNNSLTDKKKNFPNFDTAELIRCE